MAQLKKAHNETPWWARGAVLTLFAAVSFGVIVMLDFTDEVKRYGEQNRVNAIISCQRANENRAADIENLRGDIERLEGTARAERADIAGLRAMGVTDLEWIGAHGENLVGIERNIAQKEKAIQRKIASIEPFAAEPGSSQKDCEKANPVSTAEGISITVPIPFTS